MRLYAYFPTNKLPGKQPIKPFTRTHTCGTEGNILGVLWCATRQENSHSPSFIAITTNSIRSFTRSIVFSLAPFRLFVSGCVQCTWVICARDVIHIVAHSNVKKIFYTLILCSVERVFVHDRAIVGRTPAQSHWKTRHDYLNMMRKSKYKHRARGGERNERLLNGNIPKQ